jgi:hypothetical protein
MVKVLRYLLSDLDASYGTHLGQPTRGAWFGLNPS